MQIRIYYEDTDAGGVVYHSNYLNFCERARSEIFFKKNINIFDKNKGHFLVTKANCNFIKSAFLGDILDIKTKLLKIKQASLLLEQKIYKDDILIFSAEFTLVYMQNQKIAPLNGELKKEFEELF